ncbi:arylamine N-acetyltransferase [Streptomyces aurantiacus]|uniref:N-hydroxyarylamine O-acetyltransferase n=1 Tax=Streptomyces aurantiacus TaxID=47760 RepID=A0A7G1NXC6_9ACTN|nr:arylamine N-acetyltransferase [Streptomyces aurantiacus]BCL27589.1 N-hydroxyarylamine O-acetyltransferase [Streptomyces aurantiacus]
MLTEQTVSAYLDRISADTPKRLDLAALRHLHERHVLSVPFDSLDYHSGDEIYLDERVIDKIVHQRRGGGCYELNAAFYLLLQSLGFEVTVHQGRIRFGSRATPPYHHMMLTVAVDGVRWIADIGFGKGSRHPLLVDSDDLHEDAHGVFSTRRVDHRSVEVSRGGVPQYVFSEEPTELSDFAQTMWWYRTFPGSPFLQNIFCSLPLENGWVSLRDDELTLTSGKQKTTEKLADDDAVVAAYRKWFGMKLDKRPVPSPHTTNAIRFSFEQD